MRFKKLLLSTVESPQRFFLVIAVVFGLLFVATIPPFNNPDEPVHFFRVYQLSTMDLFGKETNSGILTTVPSSFIRGIQANLAINGQQINFHPEIKASPSIILQTLSYPLNENKKETTPFSSAVGYAPTSYVPQIAIMEVDRVLGLSPVVMLYSLRLAGLALYVGLIYYALKILPYRKWTVVFLALLPMSIAQAAAVTADSSLLAFLILFMAIILHLRDKNTKKIDTSVKILLAVTTIALGMSKQIFILATPLLLLVPSRIFPTKSARRLYIGGVLAGAWLLALLWDIVNPVFKTSLSNSAASIDAHARIVSTLHHPLHLIIVTFNTFLNQNSDTLYSMFGGDFGWLDTKLPLWVISLVLGLVVYCLITEYDKPKEKITEYYNWSVLGVTATLFAATCAVFYVYWTPIGSRKIIGLQGRYFIPVIILLGLLQGKRLLIANQKQYSRIINFTAPLVLLVSVATIIGRFYWRI